MTIYIESTLEEILSLRPYDDEENREWSDSKSSAIEGNLIYGWGGSPYLIVTCGNTHLDPKQNRYFKHSWNTCTPWRLSITAIELAENIGLHDLVCPPSWEQLGFEDHCPYLALNKSSKLKMETNDPGSYLIKYKTREKCEGWQIPNGCRDLWCDYTFETLQEFDTDVEARKYVWQLQLCQLEKVDI